MENIPSPALGAIDYIYSYECLVYYACMHSIKNASVYMDGVFAEVSLYYGVGAWTAFMCQRSLWQSAILARNLVISMYQ